MSTNCPKCALPGRQIDSTDMPRYRRRRRQCPGCEHRWTTYEVSGHRNTQIQAVEGAARALSRDIVDTVLVLDKVATVFAEAGAEAPAGDRDESDRAVALKHAELLTARILEAACKMDAAASIFASARKDETGDVRQGA